MFYPGRLGFATILLRLKMTQGICPDGLIFASEAQDGELEDFPGETRGWGVTLDGKDSDGNTVADATNGIPPMEWMNGILNKLSNQIFWNMQHAIPAWLAGTWSAGAFTTYDGWVYYNNAGAETSGEPSISTDWVKIFPLSNQDERYLQIGNQLSEIKSAGSNAQSAARSNLGLGTAATHNVQTSSTDTTAGSLMAVGAFGLGKGTYTGAGDDEATVASRNLGWGVFRSHGAPDAPSAAYIQMMVMGDSANADAQRSLLAIDAANNGWLGSVSTAGAVKWSTIFTTTNKPTAADTNAVAKTGDTMTGQLTIKHDGTPLCLRAATADAPFYILGQDADGSSLFYIGKGGAAETLNIYSYAGSNGIVLNADGSISISAGNSKIVDISGQAIPSNYGNFDARYPQKDGASIIGFDSDNIEKPYFRHATTNTVVRLATASYAYSKAESDAKYVQGVQLGAEIAVPNDAGTIHAGQGSFWSSVNRDHSGADDLNWYSKPIQVNINGVWHTISG
jgi:hypothetical protein